MLDFGVSLALVRGLAAPPGGSSAGDAATDLWAAFTGGSLDLTACDVEPPPSAQLRLDASIMTHAYLASQPTVTTWYRFTEGTLRFEPAIPSAEQPEADLATLRHEIHRLVLDEGFAVSLSAKVDAALDAVAQGSSAAAPCGLLAAFSNQVHAQNGKKIPIETAVDFVRRASAIGSQLGCR